MQQTRNKDPAGWLAGCWLAAGRLLAWWGGWGGGGGGVGRSGGGNNKIRDLIKGINQSSLPFITENAINKSPNINNDRLMQLVNRLMRLAITEQCKHIQTNTTTCKQNEDLIANS